MTDATIASLRAQTQGKSASIRDWLASILADEALPRNAYRVAGALAHFCNSKTLECWPSIPTLAKLARFVDRTIQRLLKALADRGYIAIEHRAAAFGCNKFRIIATKATADHDEEPALQPHVEIAAPEAREPVDVDTPEGRKVEAAWRRDTGKPLPWRDQLGRVRFPSTWLAAARLRLT